ncbi:MAG: 2-oxoacid:acceptor oxidoreductase family protein [Bacillota bacterium]
MEKSKDYLDIYLIGVGGQGIGLLSETLIRAADYADYHVRGVDTHGLAQRGGTVRSHLRIGKNIYSPLIQKGEADLVVALEVYEAYRGIFTYLKEKGTLIYYDTVWQPLNIRMGEKERINQEMIEEACKKRKAKSIRVFDEDLDDTRMQNMVIIGEMASKEIIKGISIDNYKKALMDLMQGKMLENNLNLFNTLIS